MGGFGEEVWFSLYQAGVLREYMGVPWSEVMQDYLAAVQFQPDRAEPLYRIGMHYMRSADFQLARLFFGSALRLACPDSERLFVERNVYDYELPLEFAAASLHAGEHGDAVATCNRLLRSGSLPGEQVERAVEIRAWALKARSQGAVRRATPQRIRLCIPFRDPGSAFDDCVESVLLQADDSCDVTFIDDGSGGDCADRVPVEHAGVTLLRHEAPMGFETSVDDFVANHCQPDDVVFALSSTSRLATRHVLRRIRAAFENEAIQVLYGQHRSADGSLGDAEPATDERELLERGAALASRSPVAFLARCWAEVRAGRQAPEDEVPAHQQGLGPGVRNALIRGAGFLGTRFVDHVLTIEAAEAAPGRSAPRALDGPAPVVSDPERLPKVSCLMITRDRLALAKRAIRCYRDQTYANRELVIVCDGEGRVRRGLERFVAELGIPDVRFVYPQQAQSPLGRLRNVAVDHARGEILCQWDDDDCYHPERIRMQVECTC